MAETKVYSAIESIVKLLQEGRSLPFSGGAVMVNKQRMEQLLNDLDAAIDPEIKRAEKLLARERELLEKIEQQRIEVETKAANEARTLVTDANLQAQKTISNAKKEADAKIAEATARAERDITNANEQAQRIMTSAQENANRIVETAKKEAARLVSEDNVTQNAQKYADEITMAARAECDRLNNETLGNLHQMLEHVDINLATQLNALRTLRQQLGMSYQEAPMETYDDAGYPDEEYEE